MAYDSKDIKRFWSKVNKLDINSCWEWIGGYSGCGYGEFFCNYKSLRVNRVSWELSNGPIPKGYYILHKCNNKKCCNPDHMYLGNAGDNAIDFMRDCPGHIGKTITKLYSGEIWLIRRLKIPLQNPTYNRKYKFPTRYIAKMFKVDQATILRIWNAKMWLCREGYYV